MVVGEKEKSENMAEEGVTKKKYICAVFINGVREYRRIRQF